MGIWTSDVTKLKVSEILLMLNVCESSLEANFVDKYVYAQIGFDEVNSLSLNDVKTRILNKIQACYQELYLRGLWP